MRNLVFTGPMGVGKSTISRHLSIKFNLPIYSADKLRWYYFAKHGFDDELYNEYIRKEKIDLANVYYKNFELIAFESILNEFSNGILDLGAGFIYPLDNLHKKRIETALKNEGRIFCLMPSACEETSINALNKRITRRHTNSTTESLRPLFELNKQLISFYTRTDIFMERIFVENKSISNIILELEERIYG